MMDRRSIPRKKLQLEEHVLTSVKCVWAQPIPNPKEASVDQIFQNAKTDLKAKKKDYSDMLMKLVREQKIKINGMTIQPRQSMFADLFYLTKKEVQKFIDKQRIAIKENRITQRNLRGYCYSNDKVKMRFRLFTNIAYVLPPKSQAPDLKGVWLLKTGLMLMDHEVTK